MQWRIKFTKMAREEWTYECTVTGDDIFSALDNFYALNDTTADTRFYTILAIECLEKVIVY